MVAASVLETGSRNGTSGVDVPNRSKSAGETSSSVGNLSRPDTKNAQSSTRKPRAAEEDAGTPSSKF